MNETPRANRIHIAFFGLRNAGKSTLVNAFTGQELAIVSETPGTTTDPVSKAMEILPLGPCLVTDTAGLDDVGDLGAQRVAKTLAVLATTDVAVWVRGEEREKVGEENRWTAGQEEIYLKFQSECRRRRVTVLEYRRGDSVEALRERIAGLKLEDDTPGLLDGLVAAGDRVVCVCPIDEAAPKGRLILPQVQVIRAALDLHATCAVCQVGELASVLGIADYKLQISKGRGSGAQITEGRGSGAQITEEQGSGAQITEEQGSGAQIAKTLVVTDSQAFGEVSSIVSRSRLLSPVSRPDGIEVMPSCLLSPVSRPFGEARTRDKKSETRAEPERPGTRDVALTSFSILFARQKGDLGEYVRGLAALRALKDGDTVLIAEGCTHHRQCNDIGSVKIPKALAKLSGRKLNFAFASGGDFLVSRGEQQAYNNKIRDFLVSRGERQAYDNKDGAKPETANTKPSLIVQCGGCMLTRREVLRRIDLAREEGISIVNYGMVLAAAAGIEVTASCLLSPVSRPDGVAVTSSCLLSPVSRPDGVAVTSSCLLSPVSRPDGVAVTSSCLLSPVSRPDGEERTRDEKSETRAETERRKTGDASGDGRRETRAETERRKTGDASGDGRRETRADTERRKTGDEI